MYESFKNLHPLSSGNSNPSARLLEINCKISEAEAAARDLEFLLTISESDERSNRNIALANGDSNTEDCSDFNTTDPNETRDNLYRVKVYEGELRTAGLFWIDIVTANKEAEGKSRDITKPAG